MKKCQSEKTQKSDVANEGETFIGPNFFPIFSVDWVTLDNWKLI